MMEADDRWWARAMKLTCARDELVDEARASSRAPSRRGRPSRSSPASCCARPTGRSSSPPPTWSSRSARRSRREVEGEGAVVVPGSLLVDIARLLPDARSRSSTGRRRASRRVTCGPASYRLHTYSAEDFPRLPEVDDGAAFTRRPRTRCSRRSRRVVALGLAGRVAPGADRHPGALRAGKLVMAATDSYRLAVKETELDGSAPELEAIVPARALTELARIAQARRRSSSSASHENQVVFGAGDVVADDAPHRRPVPELPAAPARDVRARGRRCRASELLDVVRRVAVMAQRNSPLRLRFAEGELTVSAQTQDVGEARESLPVAVRGRAARDRLQRRVPARRASSRSQRDERAAEADQPAAARADPRATDDDFWYLIMPIRLAG